MNDACARFAHALTTAVLDDPVASLSSLGTAHLLVCAACAARLRFEVRVATALRRLGDDDTLAPLPEPLVAALLDGWRTRAARRRASAG
ncbi:MAG: hypothetical protein JNM10_19705 [Planctomycetia bacterium]|nr:hypothetical protein [Planctomycetia bacterium]